MATEDWLRLACPECGLGFMEFRKSAGRLGCPADYAAFRRHLAPLVERVHRAARHRGKAPKSCRDVAEFAGIRALRRRMADAVASGDFAAAAAARDQLRALEGADGF
jgi:protein arginine kinase activator